MEECSQFMPRAQSCNENSSEQKKKKEREREKKEEEKKRKKEKEKNEKIKRCATNQVSAFLIRK